MKVAVIVNELNIRGGTHKQVLRLCEYLIANNIDCTIYTKIYEPEKTYPGFSKINVVTSDGNLEMKPSKNIFGKLNNIYTLIKSEYKLFKLIPNDTEYYNIHDNGFPWLMYLAKKRKNSKVIWQINDLPSCFLVGVDINNSDTFQYKIKRFLYRKLAEYIDKITVNVTKNKICVQECLKKDADVLYCGVDVNNQLVKHSFSNIKTEINLLSTGVFFTYRNYETLVEVIKKLNDENINIRLDIIGNTSDKAYAKKIQDMISKYDLSNKVKIWGQVDEVTYNDLYNKAAIFAFININQSWGLTVFEAMSCGLPTIVSNSVGAIELLNDKIDSIIVDPKDVEDICLEIKKLISNEEYYTNISNNAYKATKEYTWNNLYSSKLVKIFEEL